MSTLAEPLVRTQSAYESSLRPWLAVSANLDPRCGGVSSVMSPLCRAIREAGSYEMSLAAFGNPDEDLRSVTPGIRAVERYKLSGLKSFFNRDTRTRLQDQISSADGVHIHGLWQEHSRIAAELAQAGRKPYMVSAHGMLDPWALKQKRFKKSVYLNLIERGVLRNAACLHALTLAEADDYRRVAPGVPIAVVPNGVEVPDYADADLFFSEYPDLRGKKIVLFLSRIHPKKGLDILTRAWREVSASRPEAHLVLAGPDAENTRAGLEESIRELGIGNTVTFTGMLGGQMKWSSLSACDLFVLPSYSEGLSMAVLEAMGMCRPVLVSRECHVDGVTEFNCGWEIRPTEQELTNALSAFFDEPSEQIKARGENGGNLVRTSYSWCEIGQQISSLYEWMATGKSPAHVDLV